MRWLIALAAILGVAAASAQEVSTPRVTSRLVASGAAIPGGTLRIALDQRIIEHWHSYWINPGDTGLPTKISWHLPPGWQAGPIIWPAPRRYLVGAVVNFGYEDKVRLLTDLQVPSDAKAGDAVLIEADVSWLVCEKICIPEKAHLTLKLTIGEGTPGPDITRLFQEAEAALPEPNGGVTLVAAETGYRLDWKGDADSAFFLPEDKSVVAPSAPQTLSKDATGLHLAFAAKPHAEPVKGILLVQSGESIRALAVGGTVAPSTAAIGLWHALLLAMTGGMILNLMPCVFPVLSMKALALATHGSRHARSHGLAYAAGVIVCFALVAGTLIGLRSAGAQIGWGFQLQSPVVVAVLADILLLLGLSMSGVFHIGGGLIGVGTGLASREGYAGSFFTGVLATVVATPCTAPLMGAAVGFALTQPWRIGIAVFLALGFGMALPFLLLTNLTWLLRRLPRPGAWMERLKQILAFPLYGSAAWLVWVVSVQAGADGVAAILAGMLLLAFAAWLVGLDLPGAWRWVGQGVMVTALVGSLLLANGLSARPAEEAEQFSETRVASLRADGHPVLVNLTAAWCLTCLVNERAALSRQAVRQAMSQKSVVYLKGDWTNQDAAITATLQHFGRDGVPLYLLYRPGAAEPEILPQILTEDVVLRALAKL